MAERGIQLCITNAIKKILYEYSFLPKAAIIPNITQKSPPITGSGIIMNTAPNLLITPWRIIRTQAYCMTLLLPICSNRYIRG